MNRIHLPGLNGIRAIAALIVITFHIDQFSGLFGIPSLGFYKTRMATYAVILFFVLSGYLITYLLLNEKKLFKQVDIAKFYIRRMCRIWPIYYLIIILTLVFIPLQIVSTKNIDIPITLAWYTLFLPNAGYALGLGITSITPLWSVGVEEQFYAFWPFLINRSSNIFRSLVYVILIYLALRISLRLFEHGFFYFLVSLTSFDSMAIGGIAAYLVLNKSSSLTVIYHPLAQVICWLFFAVSVFYKPVHILPIFDTDIHSLVFAIIIINVSTNPRSLIKLENNLFNFLGRISYGLYVYHMLIICILSFFLKGRLDSSTSGPLAYIIIYLSVISVTVAIAFISYHYFEKLFLNLKIKYAKIKTAN